MLQSAFPSQLFIKAQARQSFSSLVAWHWSFLLSKLPFPLPQSKFASCPTLTLMIWTTELSASQRIFATWFSHTYSVKTYGNEYNKQLLDEVIVISGKIKVEVTVISWAQDRYTYRDLDYSGYHPTNLIIILLYIVLKQRTTNTPSHGTDLTLLLEIMHWVRNLQIS